MKNAFQRRKKEKRKRSALDHEWRKGLSANVKIFYKTRGLRISEEQ